MDSDSRSQTPSLQQPFFLRGGSAINPGNWLIYGLSTAEESEEKILC